MRLNMTTLKGSSPITKHELVRDLYELSVHMFNTGAELEYYGGLSENALHGRELMLASSKVTLWAAHLSEEAALTGESMQGLDGSKEETDDV